MRNAPLTARSSHTSAALFCISVPATKKFFEFQSPFVAATVGKLFRAPTELASESRSCFCSRTYEDIPVPVMTLVPQTVLQPERALVCWDTKSRYAASMAVA